MRVNLGTLRTNIYPTTERQAPALPLNDERARCDHPVLDAPSTVRLSRSPPQYRPPVTASTPSSLTPCLGAVPRITGEILSCQCSSRCRRAPPSRSPPSWPTGRRHTWCALHSRKREAFKRPPSSLLPVPAQISSDYELSTEFETELRWDPSSQSVFPRSKTTRSSPLGRQRRRLNDGREARFATHMPRAASRPPPNVDTASANLASTS